MDGPVQLPLVTEAKPIPDEEWATVVGNVPIVSVDLVVRHDGGVVLGKRQNQPGKGEWFVPGGRVHKNETLRDAVHRIAAEELGAEVSITRRLGVYEHFWDRADTDTDSGKHYVPVGFVVSVDGDVGAADAQHDSVRTFQPPFDTLDLHPYVSAYLEDAGISVDPE